VGAGTEGLAEGPLSGDERTLTECNATSQFDPLQAYPIMGQGSRSQPGEKLRLLGCEFFR
jgi:hypothetical protein